MAFYRVRFFLFLYWGGGKVRGPTLTGIIWPILLCILTSSNATNLVLFILCIRQLNRTKLCIATCPSSITWSIGVGVDVCLKISWFSKSRVLWWCSKYLTVFFWHLDYRITSTLVDIKQNLPTIRIRLVWDITLWYVHSVVDLNSKIDG